jgi:alpha-1,2-mannosyltransferase
MLPAHVAFLDHLPRLLSGESFPNLRNANGISANMSVPGLARKLAIYGLPWSSFDAMRVVGWIYTLVVLAVVARLARARRSTALDPIVWLVILLLATLRSPVLPVYGIFPMVWLLTILLAARWDWPVVRWVLLAWFVAMALVTPAWTLWPAPVHAIVTAIVLTAGSIVLAAAVLRLDLPVQPPGQAPSTA